MNNRKTFAPGSAKPRQDIQARRYGTRTVDQPEVNLRALPVSTGAGTARAEDRLKRLQAIVPVPAPLPTRQRTRAAELAFVKQNRRIGKVKSRQDAQKELAQRSVALKQQASRHSAELRKGRA